ncbi:uncharacterized protein BT62DRAFT_364001 [Guyanagaster necrorhizus]|uniref:Uncharacterized protein n=1 Tax=Guyanagaster necrorhizus TaxID=856835 RepID=A0A9P7VKQ7_9AGAR|nr:uncharacterized protein BT62DRAFT_364001 [Guyanagaster necrorhizus MCA 3950]KAG7442918.1 hypothetical protein BT62DRAFT_364001 [Guyanagaster necrorhizus MCA 3950]
MLEIIQVINYFFSHYRRDRPLFKSGIIIVTVTLCTINQFACWWGVLMITLLTNFYSPMPCSVRTCKLYESYNNDTDDRFKTTLKAMHSINVGCVRIPDTSSHSAASGVPPPKQAMPILRRRISAQL